MELGGWIAQNWFNVFSSVGIVAGLWFTATSLRSDTKTRRVANLLTITANHRELWTEFLKNDKLARVRDVAANTRQKPVTDAELVFVALVIQHINSVFYAMSDQLVVQYEELHRDIAEFLGLPIPKLVWERTKKFQNKQFTEFIESILNK